MHLPQTYFEMQRWQEEHDAKYHQDIYHLNPPGRMRHLTLHFGKYIGRLAEGKEISSEDQLRQVMENTTIDTFIIALGAANILNIDLNRKMEERGGSPLIAIDLAQRYAAANNLSLSQARERWMYQLAVPTGRMAKALESLDHMENFAYRPVLEEGVMDIADGTITTAAYLKLDLVQKTVERWKYIEERRVL